MVLTIDIGTTTCKIALFDMQGQLKESFRKPLHIVSSTEGAQEADPREWAQALKEMCASCTTLKGVRAIVVSGNGPTVVPVYGQPNEKEDLYAAASYARLWLDRRAVEEGKRVSSVVGSFVDSSFVIPKVLFLKQHSKDIYDRTQHFLSPAEYINYLLTDQVTAILHAPDAKKWYWDDHILDQLDLDAQKFPVLCNPGDVVGYVTQKAGRAWSLPSGVPVFAGGPDFFVSIVGSGAVEIGQICNRSGTSEGINLCTEHKLEDTRLMTYLHPISPYYNVSGIISTSGKAISWIMHILGIHNWSFSEMYKEMAKAPAGSNGVLFLPYLCGERAPIWDPNARGLFSGLSLSTGRTELLRSVAEGVCFAIKDVISVMEELGCAVGEFRITGGPSESAFLNQLKSDITGKPVLIPMVKDAELAGSMVIARTALGDFSNLAEAARSLVHIEKSFYPDTAHASLYTSLFNRYRETYRRLKEEI